MLDAPTIQLTIPAQLALRDLAVRVVMESCKLVGAGADHRETGKPAASSKTSRNGSGVPEDKFELGEAFIAEFVSAFSEIYNNIPIHAYRGRDDGTIQLEIRIAPDHLVVDICDDGASFDIGTVPLPDALPTGGMGIFIARSMLDELIYEPGPPNRWRLIKYIRPRDASRQSQTSPTLAE